MAVFDDNDSSIGRQMSRLNEMEVFVAVAEAGSFTAAAESLHLTPLMRSCPVLGNPFPKCQNDFILRSHPIPT